MSGGGFRAVLSTLAGDLRERPLPALASVAAMAAGVSVFVAIWFAGAAARGAFVDAVEAVAGRATHELSRPGGIDDARYAVVASLPGVDAASPQLEGALAVRAIERAGRRIRESAPPLRLLGLDPVLNAPFARGEGALLPDGVYRRFTVEPNTVVLPARWCADVGVEAGDRLEVGVAGRPTILSVIGTFDAGVLGEAARDLAVVDLATAQELLDRIGRLDRIQLVLGDAAVDAVSAALSPGERLERPEVRGERVASMMDAFRLNLLALGALALVVGGLLLFNAAQFAVVRRRPLLGQLRCLGAARRTVFVVVLAETAMLGALGGLFGVAAGAALAQGLVGSIARTVSDLYGFVRVDVAPIPAVAWGLGPVTAATVAALAAVWPALDAGRTAPREVGARARAEARFRAGLPFLAGMGVLAALAAAVLLVWPTRAWWPGVAAALFVLLACAMFVPPVMGVSLGRLTRLGERLGLVSLPLAAGAIRRSLARAGAAAAALAVALAMAVAVIVMIASFRSEVENWIAATLTADLYVSDPHDRAGAYGRVPPAAVALIARHPGVRAVQCRRFMEVSFRGRSVQVVGCDFPTPESLARFRLMVGDDVTVRARLDAGAVIISEPFATRHGLAPGDVLELPARSGVLRAEVAGIFRDFSVDRGYAMFETATFVRAFGEPGARNVSVSLRDGGRTDAIAGELRRALASTHLLLIRSDAQLRARVLDVFDRTFAVTRALQVIAIVIALVGIAVTLSALYLERAREVATLRAIGASLGRVRGLFFAESVLLSVFPALLALPLGGWLAWVLVHVINYRSFGWTLSLHWPIGAIAATCTGAVLAGGTATFIPWWLARRDGLAAALREA